MQQAVSNVDVCNWAYEGSLDAIRAALSGNPGSVSAKDSNKRTPLHWACSSGKTDVVELLVSRKAEVTAWGVTNEVDLSSGGLFRIFISPV